VLKKRQIKIIMVFENSQNWITGKDLSKLMDVTDRTIRSDIDSINNHYGETLIESSVHFGYHMNLEILQKLDIVFENSIPQTAEERCSYILHQMMFTKNEINLFELQEQVFVSNYSIENDIKQIKRKIEPYKGLKLIRSKEYLHLEGDERNKRKLYKDMLAKETMGNFLNLNNLASFYKDFDLLMVTGVFEDILHKYQYHIQEIYFPILMMHVSIAIERILHHNYIEKTPNNEKIYTSIEYKIASEFYNEIAKKIRLEVVESEIILMTLFLLGKKCSDYTDDKIHMTYKDISISKMVKDMLVSINRKFDIDFTKDCTLITSLQLHIQSLFVRREDNQISSNIYLKQIKWKYPLIFEMAVGVSDIVGRELDIRISEDEIGFIALHLGTAFERSKLNSKYRAVLIMAQGQGLSDMCVEKIDSNFDNRLEIVSCLNFFTEATIDELNPDLILTTLPLSHNLPIMTVQISLFVNYEDESRILQALNRLDKNKFKEENIATISSLIEERFFYPDLELTTPEEVIAHLCENLLQSGYVDDNFERSVMEREKMSMTSFAYSVAIPHALNVSSFKSNFSIAILKNPIPWGDYDVQLAILLAINDEHRDVMRIFFDWMSNVVMDSKEFAALLHAKNRDEFVERFTK